LISTPRLFLPGLVGAFIDARTHVRDHQLDEDVEQWVEVMQVGG